jgi:hypothetical protein
MTAIGGARSRTAGPTGSVGATVAFFLRQVAIRLWISDGYGIPIPVMIRR